MPTIQTIVPCLWFDDQAEAAVKFYTGIFKNSRIMRVSRYGEAGREIHGRPPGSVMVMEFELDGQRFTALNGGPNFKFNEAISLQIYCESQAEVDHFWTRLGEGGDPRAQQCGWLKDKYDLSWQVVPIAMIEMMASTDTARTQRVMTAMLKMKKLEIAELQRAFAG